MSSVTLLQKTRRKHWKFDVIQLKITHIFTVNTLNLSPSGDGSLHPGERSCDPKEGSLCGDLGAARRVREPGGAEDGPAGGHPGRGPLEVPGREHHLSPAAQRTLRHRWSTGKRLKVSG